MADFLNALRQEGAVAHFGATWYIPTVLAPFLLMTHVMVFARLVKGRGKKVVQQPTRFVT